MKFVGVVAGLAAAFAMNRVLASLLFSVRPSDPATIVSVVALTGVVALVACKFRHASPPARMVVV